MKITLITTVYNEEQTITYFLDSLVAQSVKPDEVIIVDGGSTDNTFKILEIYKANLAIPVTILQKKGNRSIGRNEAIVHAKNSIIACSDAGCILDKDWLKQLVTPFQNQSVDVVAGYYDALPKSIFQKCLVPYVLVMPDKVDPNSFLPATRSMAFTKDIWEKAGKFDEKLSNNEDYAFAKKLRKIGAKIIFQKSAIVHWIPRTTLWQSFYMFYRFAKGDSESEIIRPKVVFIFVRYLIGFALFITGFTLLNVLLYVLIMSVVLYLLWAIQKNYKYVNHLLALVYLPLLQLISDIAVITGTIVGIISSWDIQRMQ